MRGNLFNISYATVKNECSASLRYFISHENVAKILIGGMSKKDLEKNKSFLNQNVSITKTVGRGLWIIKLTQLDLKDGGQIN